MHIKTEGFWRSDLLTLHKNNGKLNMSPFNVRLVNYLKEAFDYEKVSTVWAEILPTTVGTKEEELDGNSMRQIVSHKITVRKNAIKAPRNDMYFIFQGQKYEVKYFMPHYQKNDLIEFYCKLVIETEEDYNV